MAAKKLPSPDLAPSSMDATNMMVDAGHKLDGSLPGSPGVVPMPGDEAYQFGEQVLNLPQPKIPGDQQPVNPQAGEHGGEGLPTSPSRAEFAQMWTTGNQPGGNQGEGNAGAGSSGPNRWKPTPSS